MSWNRHDYHDIPGTYVFDGRTANGAYRLNKLLYSFNRAENREAFNADPAAYCDRYRLPDDQRAALIAEEYLKLLKMGANIYYLAKLAVPKGFTMQDTSAAFQGITRDEFQAKLDRKAEGLIDRLEQEGGFWNG